MLSQTTEYALRAVAYLAEAGRAQNLHQIAEKTQVPEAYLAKVLRSLAAAGVLHSQRGVKGGYELAQAPAALSLLEVVNAVDPIQRIFSCPLGLEAHRHALCPLHERVDKALAAFEEEFRRTTLADLLTKPIFPGVADAGPARSHASPGRARYERPSL